MHGLHDKIGCRPRGDHENPFREEDQELIDMLEAEGKVVHSGLPEDIVRQWVGILARTDLPGPTGGKC